MATVFVSIAWLACRKFVTGAAGLIVIFAGWPAFTTALPLNLSAKEPVPGSKTFKMVTFNCLHMADYKNQKAKRSRSMDFLINSGADFICLQELFNFTPKHAITASQGQVDTLLSLYPYQSKSGAVEVEFLSKFPFEKLNLRKDHNVKYFNWEVYRLTIDGDPLTVVNMHLNSFLLSEKERNIITELADKGGAEQSIKEMETTVMEKMKKAFRQRAAASAEIAEAIKDIEGPIIVCGDFNDVPNSWAYNNFINTGFHDAYAETGFGHLITYNEHLMYFHIDQILYRGPLKPIYVKKGHIDSSDHYPLMAEFSFLN